VVSRRSSPSSNQTIRFRWSSEDDLAERFFGKVAERVRTRNRLVGLAKGVETAALDKSRNLVCDHVETPVVDCRRFDLTVSSPTGDCYRLERVVGAGRDDGATRDRVLAVARTPDPLEQSRHLPRAFVLDHVINPTDVDSQFHRGRTEQALEVAGFEPIFDVDPSLL